MDSYVCPMDADITSNEPNYCPRCGMALEKKTDQDQEAPALAEEQAEQPAEQPEAAETSGD